LLSSGLFAGAIAMRLQVQYEKRLDSIKAAIEELHRTELMDDDTQHALLFLRGLAEEKSLYIEMFNKGHLSERAFRQLLLECQQQLDAVRGRGTYRDVQPARVSRHRLEDAVLRLINKVAALAPLAARLHWQRIVLDYEIAWARLQSSRRVLDVLDTLARVEATPRYIVDTLRYQYQRTYEAVQHDLDEIAEQFPDMINDMQERLARRLLLVAEAEAIAQQAEYGTLPAPVAARLDEDIAHELHSLQGHDVAKLKLEPITLVQRMPGFQDIPLEQLADIAIRMHLQVVPAGQVILQQGDPGDYMYFIAHGVVRVARAEHGKARDLATMMAGEFFGEAALLSGRQPRNATVTAVTPCTLYRLHRDDLRVAMAMQPAIRKALEEESRKRIAMQYAG
jgi:CPA1 family monovalent cation:H+ antiporter